jgi:chromosome segregation ATPase
MAENTPSVDELFETFVTGSRSVLRALRDERQNLADEIKSLKKRRAEADKAAATAEVKLKRLLDEVSLARGELATTQADFAKIVGALNGALEVEVANVAA